MPKKTTRQPFNVPPPCYGNCNNCPKHVHKNERLDCECCQKCKDWGRGVALGAQRFKKSKRKGFRQKSPKRKGSKI